MKNNNSITVVCAVITIGILLLAVGAYAQETSSDNVDYSDLHDFSNVDLNSIPAEQWATINQADIVGTKVAEIPVAYFNPRQIRAEELKYATQEQIAVHISEFDNLRNADPNEVRRVFLNSYGVDLDIGKAITVRYDPKTGKLTGEFPSYDPKQFDKNNYKQAIIGDTVVITPLKVDPKTKQTVDDVSKSVEIRGAAEFTKEGDSLKLTALKGTECEVKGNQKGSLVTTDGSTIRFESKGTITLTESGDIKADNCKVSIEKNNIIEKTIEGKFQKNGNAILLEVGSGAQSKYSNKIADLTLGTTGYSVAVVPTGEKSPFDSKIAPNVVSYGKDELLCQGASEVKFGELKIFSKDQNSLYNLQAGVTVALGKIRFEDRGLAYQGLTDSSQITRKIDGNKEIVQVTGGNEGNIAKITKKFEVGSMLAENIYTGTTAGITSLIQNKKGEISASLDTKSLGLVASIENDPKKFVMADREFNLVLGEAKTSLTISPDAGIEYANRNGKTVTSFAPVYTKLLQGNELVDANKEIVSLNERIKQAATDSEAQQLVKSRDSFEFLLANKRASDQLNKGSFDSAITEYDKFLKQHPGSPITSQVQLGEAEIYYAKAASLGADKLVTQSYERAISLYQTAKKDPETATEASLSLAQVYSSNKQYDKARSEYLSLMESDADYSDRAKAAIGLANNYLLQNKPSLALLSVTNAVDLDRENEQVAEFKRQLESQLLKTISTAISKEQSALVTKFEEKIGDDNILTMGLHKSLLALGFFGGTDSTVPGNAGTSINLPQALGEGLDNLQSRLSSQEKGIILINSLYSKGYELSEIYNMKTADLAAIYNLPADSSSGTFYSKGTFEMKKSINDAFQNPDLMNLLRGGRQPFVFQTGGGYVDSSFLDTDWRDGVANAFNVKNVLELAAPMATVKDVPIAVWAARGISAGTKAAIGAENVAAISSFGGSIKQTLGSMKIGQALAEEYSTGAGWVDKVISGAYNVGSDLAVQTAVGEAVQVPVSKISPSLGEMANMWTQNVVGSGSLVRGAIEGAETIVSGEAKNTLRVALDAEGKIIASEAGVFKTSSAMNSWLDALEQKAKVEGAQFTRLENGVFKVGAETYFASVSGMTLPEITGKKITGIGELSIAEAKTAAETVEQNAKKAMSANNLEAIEKQGPSSFLDTNVDPFTIKMFEGKNLEVNPLSNKDHAIPLALSEKTGIETTGEIKQQVTNLENQIKMQETAIEVPKFEDIGIFKTKASLDAYTDVQFYKGKLQESIDGIDLQKSFPDIMKGREFQNLAKEEKDAIMTRIASSENIKTSCCVLKGTDSTSNTIWLKEGAEGVRTDAGLTAEVRIELLQESLSRFDREAVAEIDWVKMYGEKMKGIEQQLADNPGLKSELVGMLESKTQIGTKQACISYCEQISGSGYHTHPLSAGTGSEVLDKQLNVVMQQHPFDIRYSPEEMSQIKNKVIEELENEASFQQRNKIILDEIVATADTDAHAAYVRLMDREIINAKVSHDTEKVRELANELDANGLLPKTPAAFVGTSLDTLESRASDFVETWAEIAAQKRELPRSTVEAIKEETKYYQQNYAEKALWSEKLVDIANKPGAEMELLMETVNRGTVLPSTSRLAASGDIVKSGDLAVLTSDKTPRITLEPGLEVTMERLIYATNPGFTQLVYEPKHNFLHVYMRTPVGDYYWRGPVDDVVKNRMIILDKVEFAKRPLYQ